MRLHNNGYSNVPWVLERVGIENTNTILWHTFHQRYWSYKELTETPQWHSADRIFLVGQEGDIGHWTNFDSRIHVWDSLVKPGADRFYSYFWWWWQTVEVNKHQKLTENLTNPLLAQPAYVFDCIMGTTKEHRSYIYHLILDDNNTNRLCLTQYNNDRWLAGTKTDDEDNLKKFNLSHCYNNLAGTLLPYYNQQTANISTWVPWKIYNQSWFSIVAETRYNQNFFTEKTAKPLLAKKLFIIIGAQGALRDLRTIGIKTFDGIIDESYDLEPNNIKRWNMAFDQIRYVCSQDPGDIYQKALPILKYNQKFMFTLNWQERAISQMQKIVHGD